jgi:hypothetical protein
MAVSAVAARVEAARVVAKVNAATVQTQTIAAQAATAPVRAKGAPRHPPTPSRKASANRATATNPLAHLLPQAAYRRNAVPIPGKAPPGSNSTCLRTCATAKAVDAALQAEDKLLASAASAARAGVSAPADAEIAIGQFLGTRSVALAS